MSDQFIGLTMLVTLKSPPGAQIRGKVTGIVVGQSLTLGDVLWLGNGWQQPVYTIHVHEISDLREVQNEVVTNPPLPSQLPPVVQPTPVATANKFADPAILSMGRRPTTQPANRTVSGGPPTAASLPRPTSEALRKIPSQQSVSSRLVEPLRNLDLDKHQEAEVSEGDEPVIEAAAETQQKKKSRRLRNRNRKNNGEAGGANKDIVSSNGWRQTPLLEPSPSFQPYTILKKKGAQKHQDSGWQTEDATDVQELGEFDFLGSLAKFDKKTVFNQIRADDLTADEDRLVAHNRLPRPGTNGGKNLHYSENVLDMPNGGAINSNRAEWNSEADDTDEEQTSQRDTGSGRTSRRARSQLRGQTSRKGSAAAGPGHIPRSNPSSSANLRKSNSTFVLLPSNRRCESISALQMINLENIANNELGFSEDMMAENAGRSIAEVALAAFGKSKVHELRKIVDASTGPSIVVFAGNNKNGVRAIAAGRHLRNHGFSVMVCVLGLEREGELLDDLRRQIKVFKSFGGKILSKVEFMDHIATLQSPIQLVIDGLLGLTISFEELRTSDQATAFELIEWANRSKALVLAIDVPAGIDPTTGNMASIDGKPLYIHTDFVVAMGAPKKGLLGAMTLGLGTSGSAGGGGKGAWQLFVADIGLSNTAWKKAGTRLRRGVEFDGTWVMEMRFQGLVG